MTTVLITEAAEEHYTDIKTALRTSGAKEALRKEVEKQIDFFESDLRLGRALPKAGPTAREVVLRGGKVLMRYHEPQEGTVEIFEFLFSRNNR